MILAAGRGNRLRPLTDSIPKPLVTIGERALIEHHLIKICQAGGGHVVINHAWLGEKIESALGDGSRFGVHIDYSPELEGGLETAGGILQALPKLTDGSSSFCVINGDVFTDFSFERLLKTELEAGQLAHLVLVPNPAFKSRGDFGLEGRLATMSSDYTFSGMSVLHPDLFLGLNPGRFALGKLLKQAISTGRVTAELYEGYWSDVGTLDRLEQTRKDYKSERFAHE